MLVQISNSPGPDFGCPGLIGATIRYALDQEIHGEAEDVRSIYKVITGAVRRHKLLSDGRRQIESFHLPGDFFGFEYGPTYRLTAEAVVDSVVVVFDRRMIEYCAMCNARAARWLWQLAMRQLNHAADHMLLLGRKTALERVADFVIEMDARMRPTGAMLPMMRRDIADYLGLTIETVSRMISRLAADGVINVAGKHIKVLRPFTIDELQNVVSDDNRVSRKEISRHLFI
jgi:CRP-like cAMP-binding protein